MEDRNLSWGTEGVLRTGPLTLCFLIAALPGEEFLCCVCRSETVVPGNRLVSCEKCRHGEMAGHLNGPACPGPSRLPLILTTNTDPYATCPGLSLQASALANLNSVTSFPSNTERGSHGMEMCELCRQRVVQILPFNYMTLGKSLNL